MHTERGRTTMEKVKLPHHDVPERSRAAEAGTRALLIRKVRQNNKSHLVSRLDHVGHGIYKNTYTDIFVTTQWLFVDSQFKCLIIMWFHDNRMSLFIFREWFTACIDKPIEMRVYCVKLREHRGFTWPGKEWSKPGPIDQACQISSNIICHIFITALRSRQYSYLDSPSCSLIN